jgi:hypothetical protein
LSTVSWPQSPTAGCTAAVVGLVNATLIESGKAKPSFIFDRELRIEDAAEAYKEFLDHDFIKSVIRLDDGENGSLIDNEKVEEKSLAQKKRKRNGAHA